MSEKDRILKEADRIVDVPRNVYQRKLAVMARCGDIKPDKTHPHHKYDYVSIQNVSNHMRRLLAEEGLDVEFDFSIAGLVMVSLVNVDKPEDRIATMWPVVPDDKGYAYTTKFPLIRMFQIGDGEEGDESELATKSGQAATHRVDPKPNPRFQQLVKDVARKSENFPPDPPSSLNRGQAAPGPVPSPPPSLSRGPANAPAPGTPKSSGNMLTLQRPAKGQPAAATEPVAPSQDGEASDIELRTELLTRAMSAAQEMTPGMDELQAFKAAEGYLDKLSQTNWGKSYANLTQKQLSGLVVFFREKFGKAEEA